MPYTTKNWTERPFSDEPDLATVTARLAERVAVLEAEVADLKAERDSLEATISVLQDYLALALIPPSPT